MKRHTPTVLYKEESRLFYAALSICVALIACYMYFVSESVMHVVMRKEADAELVALAASVSQLEAEYIELQHAVSDDIATQRGFVLASEKIFIDKTPDTLVLLQN